MVTKGKVAKPAAGRKVRVLKNGRVDFKCMVILIEFGMIAMQPGTPEESTAKFRNKILGLSAVSEQNSAVPSFDEYGNAVDQKDIVAQLNEELARRQESYVRRERQYKVRIGELEALLLDSRAKKSKENSLDASMDRVRAMHQSILESVDQVQDRTSKILQGTVQEELESEKNKTDDGASAWIEKSKQLETEVEWTKELADRLDRLNQSLTRENQRLKTQFSTQENDREFLVKQLVTVKKDNVSLRTEIDALRQQLDQLKETIQPQQQQHHHPQSQTLFATASTSSLPKVHYRDSMTSLALAGHQQRPNTAGVNTLALASDADNRYKEIIKRLKRLLEVERRNLQQVRTAYKLELQNHTELEMVLKECVQDVRGEITHVSQLPLVMPHSSSSSLLGSPEHRQTETRLNSAERQRLIERLLEKEQLLSLLTAKAFPVRNGKRRGDPLLTGEAVSPEEVARLLTDVSSFSDGRHGSRRDGQRKCPHSLAILVATGGGGRFHFAALTSTLKLVESAHATTGGMPATLTPKRCAMRIQSRVPLYLSTCTSFQASHLGLVVLLPPRAQAGLYRIRARPLKIAAESQITARVYSVEVGRRA
ncbi:hypothetical protein ON010_g10032 [Phytophthora cinnamomi]|nr:hypothetical protein ON010_g10032 [Phytophthora cinnamomi]